MKKIAAILLLILNTLIINAQFNDSIAKVYYLKGRIVSHENKPLAFAHVINMHRNYATISDSGGRFTIPIVAFDTLRISSIGYYTKYIAIRPNSQDSVERKITLTSREYDLPTVNIYELRWQVFKSEFMERESEENKAAQKISTWMAQLVSVNELKMIYQSTMSPGFRINYKSKSEKSKRKVAQLEKKYKIIAPKFNDKLIKNLTGLKDNEVYEFLRYCNFSEDFLVHAGEYEIIEQILVFWKEYKQKFRHRKEVKE